jgi:hypothetical protein
MLSHSRKLLPVNLASDPPDLLVSPVADPRAALEDLRLVPRFFRLGHRFATFRMIRHLLSFQKTLEREMERARMDLWHRCSRKRHRRT